MINREFIMATLITYKNEVDEYRQPRKTIASQISIEITKPKLYQHYQVEDIRFQDVTNTCLTYYDGITTANELQVGDKTYLVNFVNSEGRINQVFLIEKANQRTTR